MKLHALLFLAAAFVGRAEPLQQATINKMQSAPMIRDSSTW